DNDYAGQKRSGERPQIVSNRAMTLDSLREGDYAREPDPNKKYPTLRDIIREAAEGKALVAGSIHMLEKAKNGKGYTGAITKKAFNASSFKEAAKAIVKNADRMMESDPFGTNIIGPNTNIVDAMGGEYAPVVGGAYYRQL